MPKKIMQVIIIGKIANFEPGGQKHKGVHVFCKGAGEKRSIQ